MNPYESHPYLPGGGLSPAARRNRVVFLAVGGGGGKILSRILDSWPSRDRPEAVAVNTDATALAALPLDGKVLVGESIARRMGCGGDAALARTIGKEEYRTFRRLADKADMVVVVSALGGGTGSGIAPQAAQAARDAGALVLAFATTPFALEGAARAATAAKALERLGETADAVVTVPNERIRRLLPKDATLEEAFAETDKRLGHAFQALWLALTRDGVLNFDFSDVQSLVSAAGNSCIFAYGEGKGENRVEEAMDLLLDSPVAGEADALASADAMLVVVDGGRNLSLNDVALVKKRLAETARPGAEIVMGAATGEEASDGIAVIVLAVSGRVRGGKAAKAAAAKGQGGLFDPDQEALQQAGGSFFAGVDPTIVDGKNLDRPTFERLDMPIEE